LREVTLANEARRAAHTAKTLPNKAPSHKAAVSRPWQQRCLIWPLAAKRLGLSSYLDSSEVLNSRPRGVASRSPLDLLSRNRSCCIAHVHSHAAHSRTRVSLSLVEMVDHEFTGTIRTTELDSISHAPASSRNGNDGHTHGDRDVTCAPDVAFCSTYDL
jgi:hypothetical protein